MPRPSKGARLVFRANRGTWFIRDGQAERGTGCDKQNRAGAEAKLQEYLASKYQPQFGVGDPDKVSVIDCLTLYSKERGSKIARPEMIAASVEALGGFWAGRVVGEINISTCGEYVAWRCAQPDSRYKNAEAAPRIGDQTARRELEDLRAALEYTRAAGRLKYAPVVTLPTKAEARDRWLTRQEAARLLWAAWKPCWGKSKPPNMRPENWTEQKRKGRHLARFILVGLYTGTRKDAILKLRWLPSTEGGWVDIDRSIIYRRGKGEAQTAKRRTPVAISDRLMPHLKRWKKSSTANVIEFEGAAVASVKRSWATAVKTAGLSNDVVPHVLRHTFASWAVQSGQPFGLVAAALGTTEKIVTEVYGHHAPEHTRSVVNSVGRRR